MYWPTDDNAIWGMRVNAARRLAANRQRSGVLGWFRSRRCPYWAGCDPTIWLRPSLDNRVNTEKVIGTVGIPGSGVRFGRSERASPVPVELAQSQSTAHPLSRWTGM